MKKNVHPYERIFRVGGGMILASLAFWGPRNKWFLVFVAPALSGLVGKCPLYSTLGINTRKKKISKTEDVEEQANKYFPVQSSSEIAAGHPIVGST